MVPVAAATASVMAGTAPTTNARARTY
jgi:hypothetical protein